MKKKKEKLSFYISSNDFWQHQLAQNWLPKEQDSSKRHLLKESLVRMQVKLVKRMPITDATRWYVRQIDANNRFSSLTEKLDAIYANVPGIYSYELLSPGSILVQDGTILYCYLLTALTEAIIENACESGTIDQLRADLGKCQRIFQDAALFDDNTLINFVIALPYVVQSDVLEWDKVCTLWVTLFVCASKEFSNRIISLLNDVEDEIDVPSGTTAQTLYNITNATREQIKATLKPHLREEWAECATDTAITHLALVFARLIEKTYSTIIMDKSLTKDEVRQGTENLPTELKIQIISALNTNDHALIEEYFADQNADHNVCLFGLYHLACQNTLWLETWLGEITLAAELYMSPQRLDILSYFGSSAGSDDLGIQLEQLINSLFDLTDRESALTTLDLDQFKPVFDAFYTPTAPADPSHPEEQVTMQQIFHCLGLRLYEPLEKVSPREAAEATFKKCMVGFKTVSDSLAGALVATSILLQFHVMSDLEPRLNTIENLHTSEAARERIQKQHEALQVQSDRHDNYASTLTRSNAVFENENMKLQQQNAELTAENEYYKNQIDQLLDMLAASKTDDQPTEEQISYPVDITPCNAFLFGGQPDFQAKLRQLIPNLRVDQRIDKASLSKADIVFLQVEYFNHGLYYGIMNICRLNNIPVVYLSSTGAKKAADQIVKEITQIQRAK